jgi:TetR/AcrR family transcriptional regulator
VRPARTSRNGKRNAEQTREAILKAAIAEFAREGLAGARTDQIARTARVNKALLYYYFGDKEKLYAAVLDHAFGSIYTRLAAILDSDLPCREKILRYAGEHFDALAGNPQFGRLVHAEMGRAGREGSPHIRTLAERYISRLAMRVQAVLREGMAAGEFRPVDPMNFALSIPALNVFYFVAAPMIRAVTGLEPLTPERIAARRAAVLDLLAHALFRGTGVPAVRPTGRRVRQKEKVL